MASLTFVVLLLVAVRSAKTGCGIDAGTGFVVASAKISAATAAAATAG